MELPAELVDAAIKTAFEEDLDERGDLTSELLVPLERRAAAHIVAKADGRLAGIDLAIAAFRRLDPDCTFSDVASDGSDFEAGTVLLRVSGKARALLSAERTALNFLQRLCGVATRTQQFVDALRGSGAVVMETRKTTPGLRYFEKYAVRIGGGHNHRYGLFDRVLIKENHFALAGNGTDAAGYRETVEQAIAGGRSHGPVTVEVRSFAEAESAVIGGADILLLDNMDVAALADVVPRIRDVARTHGRDVLLEASGGVTLDRAARIAATGVDRLSVGALTHSVPSIDLSMLVE